MLRGKGVQSEKGHLRQFAHTGCLAYIFILESRVGIVLRHEAADGRREGTNDDSKDYGPAAFDWFVDLDK